MVVAEVATIEANVATVMAEVHPVVAKVSAVTSEIHPVVSNFRAIVADVAIIAIAALGLGSNAYKEGGSEEDG